MFRRTVAPIALLCVGAAPLPRDEAAIRAHVTFLAADTLKGREAGSAEFDIAADYVAAQFEAAGLRPLGDAGGYKQAVPLVAYRPAAGARFSWTPAAGGAAQALAVGSDIDPAANPAAAATVLAAPLVFVGRGLEAPAYGLDDYAGIDVRGRIVVFESDVPGRLPAEVRLYLASQAARLATAARHGAVGAIMIGAVRGGAAVEQFGWANPDGTGATATPGTPMLGTLSRAAADRLFGARRRQPAGTLAVRSGTVFRALASSNVVGIVPGTDPALSKEAVVLSAHLDHIGVGAPENGDAINNGALDDAIGIASLIEAARRFTAAPRPRRSIVFLAVTAEEKGLIGSDFFVSHPPVPLADIVADVNLDMPILTYRFEDMVAFGGDRSTLGAIIARAVATLGVSVSPDPIPEQAIFVRSDHFRFVQKGVPAVFLWPGPKGPGKGVTEAFMATHYHRPSDDITQPIRWDQAVRFVDANYRIARAIADGDARPAWNRGDYFGLLFGGPGAR